VRDVVAQGRHAASIDHMSGPAQEIPASTSTDLEVGEAPEDAPGDEARRRATIALA